MAISLRLLLHAIGDLILKGGAGGRRHAGAFRAMTWAASSASSIFGGCERAISQTGLPVIGDSWSKYWPLTGATHLPPMKLS